LLISARRFADARKLLGDLLKAHPDETDYMTALVFIAMKENKTEEAGQIIEKILARQPANATALYYRGLIRMKHIPPDYAGARADLQIAQRNAPDNTDIRAALQRLERAAGSPTP
jgi:predicted Zn-dependent protease